MKSSTVQHVVSSFHERSREYLLIKSLVIFYKEPTHIHTLLFFLRGEKRRLSLRLLDWLVTNYSKKKGIVFQPKIDGPIEFMYLSYKNQLKSYSKKFFDAFARRQRVFYTFNHDVFEIKYNDIEKYSNRKDGFVTTLAQLNAFRFFITSGIIDYTIEHLDDIEKDMIQSHDKMINSHDKTRDTQLSHVSSSNDTTTCKNFKNDTDIKKDNNTNLNIHHQHQHVYTKPLTGFHTVLVCKFKITVDFGAEI